MAVVDGVPFQNLSMRPSRTWWQRSTDPLLDVPSAAERHRKEGAEAFFAGLRPKELPEGATRPPLHFTNIESPGGALLGGLQWAMSPVSGAFESLWDKPVSESLQVEAGVSENIAKQISLYGSMMAPGIGFGMQLGRLGSQVAAQTPTTMKAIDKALKQTFDKKVDASQWKGFRGSQAQKVGAEKFLTEGDVVYGRLHLNVRPKAGEKTGTDFFTTIHHGKKKTPEADYNVSPWAYDQGLALTNAHFDVSQAGRILVAGKQKPKHPIASVGGNYRPLRPAGAEREIKKADVVASFNPARGNFFVDVKTNAPVKSADKAILKGDKVYLSGNVKYWERGDLPPSMEQAILRTDFPLNWNKQATSVIATSKAGPYRSDIFDFSQYGDVPGQPQFPIPRIELTDYQQAKWDKLITPDNLKQTIKHVDEGLAHGGFEWYDLEPLRYRFMEELGPKIGNQQFTEFVQMVGATSPGSRVPINIRRAAYFYHLLQNSKNPTAAIAKWKQGGPTGLGHQRHWKLHTPGLEQTYAHPFNYGLLTTKAGEMQPKTSGFSHNLMGNWQPTAMDLHMMRLLTGGKVTGSAPKAAYAHPEGHVVDIAKQVGVTPAQAQAAAWTGFTGYKDKPFLVLFEEIIKKTATKRGKTPDQILKDWINGNVPLASVLPMGATQLGTEIADDIFGEKLIG